MREAAADRAVPEGARLRIRAVIPTADWAQSAGVRIRYQRVEEPLGTLGHDFAVLPIEDLETQTRPEADVYLFCKCHDLRAVLLAARLRAAGICVGVDLFDDYFTQIGSSRFTHLRDWFARIRPHLSFGLVATPAMQAVLGRIAPGLQSHVMNDPFDRFVPEALAPGLRQKAEAARAVRHVRLAWFGTGDNPHFSVGLEDLAALGSALDGFRRAGWTADLTILTNRRAMTTQRLQMLSRLPLPWTIEEWSEDGEAALVAQSLVCVLPVNAQGFSTAKSLNRAVTALTGGAQVLSLGYPLYAPLETFVYRDPAPLVADLAQDRLRLRPATLDPLLGRLRAIGDPVVEAAGLAAFLAVQRASPRPAPPSAPVSGALVLQGIRATPEVHRGFQRMGHLTVANPLMPVKLPCDVVVTIPPEGGRCHVVLSPAARAALAPEFAGQVTERTGPKGATHAVLRLTATDLGRGPAPDQARTEPLLAPFAPLRTPPRRLEILDRYPTEAARLAGLLALLFPGRPLRAAELSAPYRSGLP